ncbi:ribonuclease domain-containing protein [Desertibaculum subflavum]|uniref:ribonuclease domain-containing protein n=1 Tax=Desertibaculum subflavum TaxID=2268458 RepID=UPI000E67022D
MRHLLRILLLVLLSGPAFAASDAALEAFAQGHGLKDVGGFIETVRSIESRGRLPDRYVTKSRAEQLGWRPGRDLCEFAMGRSIGGDRFGNREKRLQDRPGRTWTEADLDYVCGRRGAKRLVFSSDRLIYVTVDHYRRFHQVPR